MFCPSSRYSPGPASRNSDDVGDSRRTFGNTRSTNTSCVRPVSSLMVSSAPVDCWLPKAIESSRALYGALRLAFLSLRPEAPLHVFTHSGSGHAFEFGGTLGDGDGGSLRSRVRHPVRRGGGEVSQRMRGHLTTFRGLFLLVLLHGGDFDVRHALCFGCGLSGGNLFRLGFTLAERAIVGDDFRLAGQRGAEVGEEQPVHLGLAGGRLPDGPPL